MNTKQSMPYIMKDPFINSYYFKIANILPKNPVFVDAGANNGQEACEMADSWPDGKIFAFEPNPYIYNVLKENTKNLPNVKTFNLALSDKIGSYPFFMGLEKNSYGSSLHKPLFVLPHTETTVPVTTLDAWAEENQISHIDYLWMDVQGGEGLLLKGAPKILKTIRVIDFEFYTFQAYEGIVLLDEIKEILFKLGFLILYLEPENNGRVVFIKK